MDGPHPSLAPPVISLVDPRDPTPEPSLVYATDAVLDAGVHVLDETYLPVCGPLWCYIAKADNEETFSEKEVMGLFVDRIGRKGEGNLRMDILRA